MAWYLVWLVGYMALVYAVGIAVGRRIKTSAQYLLAESNLGFFPIAGTIFSTSAGAAYILGGTGKGFQIGISWGFMLSAATIFSILAAVFLGPTIRRLKLYTLPDLFVRRYGKISGIVPSAIIAFAYMVPTLGLQLVGIAAILGPVFHVPLFWGIMIAIILTTGFTLIGGFTSVAWTDAIQSIIIIGGLIVLMVLGVHRVGGWSHLLSSVPPTHLTPRGNLPLSGFVNFAVIFGPFYAVWQTTWQRLAAAKDEKTAVLAVSSGWVACWVFGFTSIFIGIAATQLFPPDTRPDLVYTKFMKEIFHPALGGLFLVALFSALLTGASSWMISGASNIAKDLYQGWVKPEASDKEILRVSKYSVLLIAILGIIVALAVRDIITIYTYALSFTAITIFFPVMGAMFWRRTSKMGVLVSVFGSLIFAIIWIIAGRPFGLHEIIPGMLLSLILLVVTSLRTNHSPEEDVTAYFFDLKKTAE